LNLIRRSERAATIRLDDCAFGLSFVPRARVPIYLQNSIMGFVPPNFVIKNSFIHVVDGIEQEPAFVRPRALSADAGTCMVKKNESKMLVSLPTNFRSDQDVDLGANWQINTGAPASASSSLPSQDANLASVAPPTFNLQCVDDRVTVMMRNIPNLYSCNSLLELFDAEGFWSRYDFFYFPVDFRTGVNLGYGFVNFVSNRDAQEFMYRFCGFQKWRTQSPKVCDVTWTTPHQGLRDHVERYRNSPLMHDNVSDDLKPRLYEGGSRVAFPEPTKRLRAPRVRPQKRLSR